MASTTPSPAHLPHSARVPQGDFSLWRLCAWAGPVFVVATGISWVGIARFVPPPQENWTADRVADFYRSSEVSIRIGMEGVILSAMLYFVWSLAVMLVMRRNEGRERILSTIQFVGGVITACATTAFAIFWLLASFRSATRPVNDILLLNDTAWMTLVMTFVPTALQMFAFAIFILRDERPTPLYPRWVAYLTFWLAATLFPGLLMPSFQTGPFAWHGLITLYIGLSAFFTWTGIVSLYTFAAIGRIESDDTAMPAVDR